MSCIQAEWPEPVVRVQSLSDSRDATIPDRYIKPPTQRPQSEPVAEDVDIPMIDLSSLSEENHEDQGRERVILTKISEACREWGFFQITNHGVSGELMDQARAVWREFFHLPMEEKQKYANSPKTYEGYGSRLGVEKGAILDWNDYYFLHYLPPHLKDYNKWPAQPPYHREVMEEYLSEMVKLCRRLMKILSINLGIEENRLQDAFGGEDNGVCLRVNFYPKCPQPDLTLGLSSHSDPGGLTLLLPDPNVSGLQVRKDGKWVTVKPFPHAFVVNIGDQIQVLSNGIYKSVEHRAIVNQSVDRVSLALFHNPKGDLPLEPVKELVGPDSPALYQPMTFDEYRLYIRLKGPRGKFQVESLKTSHQSKIPSAHED